MTDSTEKDKTLSLGSKLSLNRSVEGGRIKQSFSHGRSKTVAVEVRKARTVQRDESGKIVEVSRAPSALTRLREEAKDAPAASGKETASQEPVIAERQLTNEEMQLRRKVLERAHANQDEESRVREEERRVREERSRKRKDDDVVSRVQEVPVPVAAEALSVEELREVEARKEKAKKKKIEDDFEEAEAQKKNVKKRRHRGGADDAPPSLKKYDAEDFDNSDLLKVTEDIVLPRTAAYDDELEFEDYSEEEPTDQVDDSIVAVAPREVDESRLKVVRPIQSSDRVVMAAVDPNKTKKYLRSEAPIAAPRRRSEPTTKPMQQQEKKPVGIKRSKRHGRHHVPEPSTIKREVVIPETIVVSDLANRMAVRAVDVIKSLMKMGTMVMQNQSIDADTAQLIVEEFGHTFKRVTDADVEQELFPEALDDTTEGLQTRAPVVTVMGHVDHGKTSLLDAIRATNVVAKESGGITQHIGAYQVTTASGKKIAFIDTPGHEAFTAMRARGAKVTDIVVLVVAADDGIKQQTVEAINHAKAAGVPIIVAVNKVDKPDADPARVRQELMSHELVTEEFGGDIIAVDVSAKQKLNIDLLLENILLQAEVLDLKANPDVPATGTVVEARVDKGRGVVATVLVQRGTLRVGDIVVAGTSFGYARALVNEHGEQLQEAGPSTPVEVLGLAEVPNAGDRFAVSETDRQARDITDFRITRGRELKSASSTRLTLEDLFSGGQAKVKELPVILKGDVHGSVEAIAGSLDKIDSSEVKARVIHSGVGAITESDVALANASNAIILAFNVRANAQAKELAAREKIDIRYYSVIYDLVDDVKKALSGLLSPTFKENFLGYAEIRQVFNITKAGKVAGCMVTSGIIKRSSKVRLLRDNVVIHEGSLKTLKRFKEDVREVKDGFECGIAFENYEDIRAGDQVEAFELEQVTRAL